MRRRLLLLSPLMAGTIPSAIPGAPAERAECQTVEGTIDAHVDALRPAVAGIRFKGRGLSAGDLPGHVSVDVVRRLGNPQFEAEFAIASARGRVDVSGIARTGRGIAGVYPVTVTLDVIGGSGAFAGVAGELNGTGIADKNARTMAFAFKGRLCTTEPRP